jgi:protein-L-isoaspartate(D-aspartate) O-methyltransferase
MARADDMTELANARRHYVERIKGREHITSDRLLQALEAVPREDFLRKGPWRIKSEFSRNYHRTENADPIHLYDNVLVAIDARRRLDTGLPSLWAHFIDVLNVAKGERVVQIGCGLGYYSAVLSRMVGAKGKIRAIECDETLAERARENLRDYRNVEVVCSDGSQEVGAKADVIIVHAGFTQPHPAWIEALRPGGRLLVPLTGHSRDGTVIMIKRLDKGYQAEAVRRIAIFPGQGRGVTALDERVVDWWERASALAPLRFRRIEQGLPHGG